MKKFLILVLFCSQQASAEDLELNSLVAQSCYHDVFSAAKLSLLDDLEGKQGQELDEGLQFVNQLHRDSKALEAKFRTECEQTAGSQDEIYICYEKNYIKEFSAVVEKYDLNMVDYLNCMPFYN